MEAFSTYSFKSSFNLHYAYKISPCCHTALRYLHSHWVWFSTGRIYHNLSMILLMLVWIVSTLRVLWTMPLWTFLYKYPDSYVHEFLWVINQETCWVIIMHIFNITDYAKLFSEVLVPIYTPVRSTCESLFHVADIFNLVPVPSDSKYSHVPHQTSILSSDQQTPDQIRIISHVSTELLMHWMVLIHLETMNTQELNRPP